MVLAAVPTLAFMFAATWILMRFVAAREPLGAWTFTVNDGRGAVVGHGDFTLTATAWSTAWDAAPPFVTFTPRLSMPAGQVTLDHHPSAPLHSAYFRTRLIVAAAEPDRLMIALLIHPDQGDPAHHVAKATWVPVD
jgi:hypothetical protein